MMRSLVALLAAIAMSALPAPEAVAQTQTTVSVTTLLEDPVAYSGQTVTIEGEIIGDYAVRSDDVWVQVNDDAYADTPLLERPGPAGTNTGMGVRYPRSLHDEEWGAPGRYGTRGPIVRVTGIFRYNEASQGGETFVDATTVDVIHPARPVARRELDMMVLAIGGLLFVGGILAGVRGRTRGMRHPG